jgi:hypothetical protein
MMTIREIKCKLLDICDVFTQKFVKLIDIISKNNIYLATLTIREISADNLTNKEK